MGDTEQPSGVDPAQMATSMPLGAPTNASTPMDVQQWQTAVAQWQQAAQQQAGRKGAPFYPLAGAHPAAYGALWGGQPLMYGAPFYSMPFPYPPATAQGQPEGDAAAGGSASAAAEKKPDSNGPAKSGDNASDPDSNGGSEGEGAGEGSGGLKAEGQAGAEAAAQQQQQFGGHAPTDAAAMAAGSQQQQQALAAMMAAASGGLADPAAAELWRQRTEQLAGSGVDLSQLAANAAGQGHVVQDERELKRARRKQSNRESARRSRLRKQAECEGLASKVTGLEAENARLKEEVRLLQAQLAAALAAKAQ